MNRRSPIAGLAARILQRASAWALAIAVLAAG
jgi:hypothetical protein